jgi:hypothetical protein
VDLGFCQDDAIRLSSVCVANVIDSHGSKIR